MPEDEDFKEAKDESSAATEGNHHHLIRIYITKHVSI